MRALITGSSGFIGSRLVSILEAEGVDVKEVKHKALGRCFDGIDSFIRDIKPDVVFHLAGLFRSTNVYEMIEANCLYAAKLLDALKSQEIDCRIVLMGSAAEYGIVEESALPIREDQHPRPETPYGISKLSQTMIGLSFAADGMDVVIARPYNVLGVGMSEFLAISGFARQLREIKSGRIPPVLKTGNLDTRRDFISVNSCVRALIFLGSARGAAGRIVNICSGKTWQIRYIVERMIEMIGLPVHIQVDDKRMRRSDPQVNFGDPSLLRSLTGYMPVLTEKEMDKILTDILGVNIT